MTSLGCQPNEVFKGECVMVKRIILYTSLYLIVASFFTGCTQWKKLTNTDQKKEQQNTYALPPEPSVASTQTLSYVNGGMPNVTVVWLKDLKDGSSIQVYLDEGLGWKRLESCHTAPLSESCYYFEKSFSLGYYVRFSRVHSNTAFHIWKLEPK